MKWRKELHDNGNIRYYRFILKNPKADKSCLVRQAHTRSDSQLLTALRDAVTKLQRRPKARDMEPKHGRPSVKCFHRTSLGGLSRSLRLIGMVPDRHRHTTLEEDLAAFREVAELLGRAPSQQDALKLRNSPVKILRRKATFAEICLFSRLPSPMTVKNLHNMKWAQFSKMAGFKPNKPFHGSFWVKWERLCKRIAIACFGKAARVTGTKLSSGKLPDIVIDDSNKRIIVDAKLSAYRADEQLLTQIEEYSKHCDELEFWCLTGGHEYSGVLYRYPKDLFELLDATQEDTSNLEKQLTKFVTQWFELGEPGFWDEAMVISGLHSLAKELGRPPTLAECDGSNYLPSMTTLSRFRPYQGLLEKAGLDPNMFTHWSDEQLIDRLGQFADEHPYRLPRTSDFGRNTGQPNNKLFIERFGTFDKALILARYHDRVATWLMTLGKKLGRPPSRSEFTNAYCDSNSVERLFKSVEFDGAEASMGWGRALEYAGLVEDYRSFILDEIHANVTRLGDIPRYSSFFSECLRSDDIKREFGKWKTALSEYLKQRHDAQTSMKDSARALQISRENAGYTQAEVARAIGSTQSNYSAYETGRAALSFKNAVVIANMLGVELGRIVCPQSAK